MKVLSDFSPCLEACRQTDLEICCQGLWAPGMVKCVWSHLYTARPASSAIQSRAKSIWRTKDDILLTTV